jgi:hypothetical protein
MENLFYDLSEQEFTKGRKILLWIFASFFFLGGLSVIFNNVVLGDKSIHIGISLVPFAISIFVGIIAVMSTFKRKDHFFAIDEEKISFRYGLLKPVKQLFKWDDIKEIHFPHKERKALLIFKDNSSIIVNLTWLERKKSSHIRKHLFYMAREKNINIVKIQMLKRM